MKAQISGAITRKAKEMTTLSSYLLFEGNCRQAMEFYRSCLGGELIVALVKDTPAKEQMPEFQHDKVVNARLRGSNFDISASDWLRPDQTPIRGNTACLYLSGGTFQELKSLYEKLSEGGDTTDPLSQHFFGTYGALNDKFGVRWMFHTDSK
jgi:PhnB protein